MVTSQCFFVCFESSMSPLIVTFYSCPQVHTKGAMKNVFFLSNLISAIQQNENSTQNEKKNPFIYFTLIMGFLKLILFKCMYHIMFKCMYHTKMVIIVKYQALIKDCYFTFCLYLQFVFVCLFFLLRIRKNKHDHHKMICTI